MSRIRLFSLLAALSLAISCGGKSSPPSGSTGPTTAGADQATTQTPPALSAEQILAASDLPELLPEPLPGDKLGVTVHRLSNGMTVYISTDRQKPRFNAWIAVRAGSRHDPANSTGLAHYLEHMLFKGTSKLATMDFAQEKPHLDRIAQLYDDLRAAADPDQRKAILAEIDQETQAAAKFAVPNELDQLYGSLGIEGINAFTWFDMTVYIADVPSNRLQSWVSIESERFTNPQFRLFYPELEAVYEEKNRSLDDADERVEDAKMEALFPKHPYGTQTTIGSVEHLKSPAYSDMAAFYQRWYAPNNMAIVLAGDIDAATALPALEAAFGSWQPKALETPAPAEAGPLDGPREITIEAPGKVSVTIGWPTVGVNHPDAPVIEVMDALMSDSGAGLLETELVISSQLPQAVSSPQLLREAGSWSMVGVAREGQSPEEVQALLLGVLAKLKAGDFTDEHLQAVVLRAEMREQAELESPRSRVGKIAEAFWNHTPWEVAATRSKRLAAVTRQDVVRVANQYITDNYVVVKRVKGKYTPPKIEKPTITPVPIDPSKGSEFAATIRQMPAAPLEPEWLQEGKQFQRAKLPAGKLLYATNDINELYSLAYEIEVGRREQPLLCLALDLMEKSGTDSLSPTEVQATLYRTGTKISFSCGVETVTIKVTGIDRTMEQGIALLDQWLRTAKLDAGALAKFVDNEISQRKDSMQEPRMIGYALSSYATLGAESSFLQVASDNQLQKAKPAQLSKLVSKLPDYRHETRYFGPRSLDEASKVIGLGKKHRKTRARKPVAYRRTKGKVQIFFLHKQTAQSQINLMMPKAPATEGDRVVRELFNSYVGGMGGLIFQEIREARGLAYSSWAFYAAGARVKDQSGLMAGIGTQNDKTLDALTTLLGLLRGLPQQPERFAKAKVEAEQGLRTTRIAPREIVSTVSTWDELGYKVDPRASRWEALKSLTNEELQTFAKQFSSGDLIISVMGDRSRIDMEALGKIGTITEVKVEQIFGY